MSEVERIVLKFGGTSVRDLEAWEALEAIVRMHLEAGRRIVVVHSALPGVTNALEQLAGLGEGASAPGTAPRQTETHPAESGHGLEASATAPSSDRVGGHRPNADPLAWIVSTHEAFARALLGEVPEGLREDFVALREAVTAVRTAPAAARQTAPPRPARQAALLAMGERMATRVGAAWLAARGLPVTLLDARELLVATDVASRGVRHWLSAECSADFDPELRARLDALPGQGDVPGIGLTQGFTAQDPDGGTVVLGRGGSDTAAAYLAGRWGADRLEIWSDVPGMFTADPRRIPEARLLRRVSRTEAQEIATTGSRVLHPRCLPALRDRPIPVQLRSTLRPEDPGTCIEPTPPGDHSRLRAISWKENVVLVSMETVGMWQEVGFLARAFRVFHEVGLSVDLVSTSETNVTVSLDAAANLLDPARLDALVRGLEDFCRVEVIEPCAAVSLVGNRIRGMLHRLAPAFESFEEHRIHLVSQAASDLNFTVVVDREQGERLARKLHRMLLAEPAPSEAFGPSWSELVEPEREARPPTWWERDREALLECFGDRDAAYVYHLETVRERVRSLVELGPISRVLYAMKANPHPRILEGVREAGGSFECVSRGEIERVLDTLPDLDPGRILFTPNFAPREEYAFALEAGVQVTLDALHPLERWPELFRGREILVRVDPGRGAGHHEKVSTAGVQSKFGVHGEALGGLRELADRVDARIVGLHVHAGSGISGPDHWRRTGHFLMALADDFPSVRYLDLGGGFPVPGRRGDPPLDLEALREGLHEVKMRRPELELWVEPGRYLVAEAGVLLARVTQVKAKGTVRYVGVATGMNSLIRPALYGAFHEIVNLTRLGEEARERVQVVGPICETGDRLGVDRLLPHTDEGDVLLVAEAGAYGHAMASSYNLRRPAEEMLLSASSLSGSLQTPVRGRTPQLGQGHRRDAWPA